MKTWPRTRELSKRRSSHFRALRPRRPRCRPPRRGSNLRFRRWRPRVPAPSAPRTRTGYTITQLGPRAVPLEHGPEKYIVSTQPMGHFMADSCILSSIFNQDHSETQLRMEQRRRHRITLKHPANPSSRTGTLQCQRYVLIGHYCSKMT